MGIEINQYEPDAHLGQLASAIRASKNFDETYPPDIDLDGSSQSFENWLVTENELGRFVALCNSVAIAHCGLVGPEQYLRDFLEATNISSVCANGFSEITKLFIHPQFAGRSIGSQLVQHTRAYSWSLQYQPALAVLASSKAAIHLYEKVGFSLLGKFEGRHGVNFVFVDRSAVS